jgi:hypothetical protein
LRSSSVRARLLGVLHYRVCPECEEEFRPEIVHCSDCGTLLVERWESEDGEVSDTADTPPSAPASEPTPDLENFRPLVTQTTARLLVPHAERLKEQDIPFRLSEIVMDAERHVASYHILVREEDRSRALEAIADLIDPNTDALLLNAVEEQFQEGKGYVCCPACGASLPERAAECPECGLAVAPGMDLPPCPSCGAPLVPDEERCSACGHETSKNA